MWKWQRERVAEGRTRGIRDKNGSGRFREKSQRRETGQSRAREAKEWGEAREAREARYGL